MSKPEKIRISKLIISTLNKHLCSSAEIQLKIAIQISFRGVKDFCRQYAQLSGEKSIKIDEQKIYQALKSKLKTVDYDLTNASERVVYLLGLLNKKKYDTLSQNHKRIRSSQVHHKNYDGNSEHYWFSNHYNSIVVNGGQRFEISAQQRRKLTPLLEDKGFYNAIKTNDERKTIIKELITALKEEAAVKQQKKDTIEKPEIESKQRIKQKEVVAKAKTIPMLKRKAKANSSNKPNTEIVKTIKENSEKIKNRPRKQPKRYLYYYFCSFQHTALEWCIFLKYGITNAIETRIFSLRNSYLKKIPLFEDRSTSYTVIGDVMAFRFRNMEADIAEIELKNIYKNQYELVWDSIKVRLQSYTETHRIERSDIESISSTIKELLKQYETESEVVNRYFKKNGVKFEHNAT
jgi:hypothetical protein